MNAVMREPYEEPVVANEDNIGALRIGLAEVKEDVRGLQADMRSLRDKQDATWEKVDNTRSEVLSRVEQARKELSERIDRATEKTEEVRTELTAKIERATEKTEQVRTELTAKIDQLDSKLTTKIDQVDSKLTAKIDQVNSNLTTKIDHVNSSLTTRIDQVDSRLNTGFQQIILMIGQTNVEVASIKSLYKTVIWVFGGVASLPALIEIGIRLGKTFGWF